MVTQENTNPIKPETFVGSSASTLVFQFTARLNIAME